MRLKSQHLQHVLTYSATVSVPLCINVLNRTSPTPVRLTRSWYGPMEHEITPHIYAWHPAVNEPFWQIRGEQSRNCCMMIYSSRSRRQPERADELMKQDIRPKCTVSGRTTAGAPGYILTACPAENSKMRVVFRSPHMGLSDQVPKPNLTSRASASRFRSDFKP